MRPASSPRWRVRIEKRIPVAAGLGGGSSDAATALRLANAALDRAAVARRAPPARGRVGADVPFFLRAEHSSATGDGTELERVDLPTELLASSLVVPHDVAKESTRAVYAAFDERDGADGFVERADALSTRARASRDRARPRPRCPPQRPRVVAARARARGGGGVPRGRVRRGPDRLRPLRGEAGARSLPRAHSRDAGRDVRRRARSRRPISPRVAR